VIKLCVVAALFFNADSRAVRASKLDSGVYEFLQDGVRALNEGAGQPFHTLRLKRNIARVYMSPSASVTV
jgi:hypothetical protein